MADFNFNSDDSKEGDEFDIFDFFQPPKPEGKKNPLKFTGHLTRIRWLVRSGEYDEFQKELNLVIHLIPDYYYEEKLESLKKMVIVAEKLNKFFQKGCGLIDNFLSQVNYAIVLSIAKLLDMDSLKITWNQVAKRDASPELIKSMTSLMYNLIDTIYKNNRRIINASTLGHFVYKYFED